MYSLLVEVWSFTIQDYYGFSQPFN